MKVDGFEDEVASGAYLGYPDTPVTFREYFGEQKTLLCKLSQIMNLKIQGMLESFID